MMPLSPRDNALFVRNFRERMRPHIVGSYAVVLFAAVMVLFMLLADVFAEAGRQNALFSLLPRCVPAGVLAALSVFQGTVLLGLGTLSAYRMALQDRFNGTLDFFRATPTKSLDHIMGLVFGAALTEWYFFLLLVPVMLVLALLSDVGFAALAEFYVSLMLCAVFFHSLGVLAGVCSSAKKHRAAIKALLLTALVCAGTGALIFARSSVAYHTTFLPAYIKLLTGCLDRGTFAADFFLNYSQYIFFDELLPSLTFQALVQVPLCALAWLAIKRRLSSAEVPVLSRPQLAALIALFLFYFTGDSLVSAEFRGVNDSPEKVMVIYFFLFFFLALLFILLTAPTALACRKGFSRAFKLGARGPGWLDEQGSCAAWTALLCVLFGLVYVPLGLRFRAFPWLMAVSFAMLLLQISLFAGAYEYFSLSRLRGKNIVFAAALFIVWVALPSAEAIVFGTQRPFFLLFTPFTQLFFWGGAAVTKLPADLTLRKAVSDTVEMCSMAPRFTVFLVILAHYYLLALSGFFNFLAARERRRIGAGGAADRGAPVGGI